jgi:amino acid adenylation domain-containing protein
MNNGEIAEHNRAMQTENLFIAEGLEDTSDIPQLNAIERQQLAKWNATQQEYPRDACIHQIVSKYASTTPDAVALVASDQMLSYRKLNQRANQLAHYLQVLGVRPNVLVGLCIERSVDMVVGLLGILKAGGAYVPLDPSYPPERLTFMLEDAQAPVLVTQQSLATRLPTGQTRVVCLDADFEVLAGQSETEPTSTVTVDDLVYVIYTSGSTGRSKGVQITHSSLLNLVFWHQRAFAVTSADRATQIASPAFDATGWELWPYLTIGASVYLPDEDIRAVPTLLRDWLVSHGITITFLPTALTESVMVLEWPSTTSLRYLLTGADTLHHYPSPSLPFALINNYGPTEATVVATFARVPPNDHPDGPPSIGRPIDNTEIYILDEHLRQVSIGVSGELYIGGAGLARGYLNRPELTAEKFIPHPFSDDPHTRLYKTGDLARFLPDGQIAFLGRNDHQIKIRGYRIEPNEIASVLNEHPAIQTSLVVAREDVPGEKYLVAYLVLVSGAYVTVRSLQDTLATQLPDYMIPATFVVLESLPLTPNGKIDRASLPMPDTTNMLQDEVIALPSTPTEERLAAIVTSLMNLEQVGVDDNFFLLGGHSLLGTQIIAQIAETFRIDLPLRSLFNAPTVRLLSAEIERLILARVEAMSEEEVLQLLQQG